MRPDPRHIDSFLSALEDPATVQFTAAPAHRTSFMVTSPDPTGTVATALAHAERLLAHSPGLAAEQALEILKAAPNHPVATLLLGKARRMTGDAEGAAKVLEALTNAQPNWAAAALESLHHAVRLSRRCRMPGAPLATT